MTGVSAADSQVRAGSRSQPGSMGLPAEGEWSRLPPRPPETVAVDFDGVIHTYDKGWQDGAIYGEPVHGAFEGLRALMSRYAVFIHTSRDPGQVGRWMAEHSDIPVEWFQETGIRRSSGTTRTPS